jgi:hypothetical protein
MKAYAIMLFIFIYCTRDIYCQPCKVQPVPINVIENWINGSSLDSIRSILSGNGFSLVHNYIQSSGYYEEWDYSSDKCPHQKIRRALLTVEFMFSIPKENPGARAISFVLYCRQHHSYLKNLLLDVKKSYPQKRYEDYTFTCNYCDEEPYTSRTWYFSRSGSGIKVSYYYKFGALYPRVFTFEKVF